MLLGHGRSVLVNNSARADCPSATPPLLWRQFIWMRHHVGHGHFAGRKSTAGSIRSASVVLRHGGRDRTADHADRRNREPIKRGGDENAPAWTRWRSTQACARSVGTSSPAATPLTCRCTGQSTVGTPVAGTGRRVSPVASRSAPARRTDYAGRPGPDRGHQAGPGRPQCSAKRDPAFEVSPESGGTAMDGDCGRRVSTAFAGAAIETTDRAVPASDRPAPQPEIVIGSVGVGLDLHSSVHRAGYCGARHLV